MPSDIFSDHPLQPIEVGWHAVALSRDLPPGMPLPVVFAGREIVVWRAEGGAVRAWADRCPHRGMRLSFGFVRGDTLSCLYHGWRYRGSDGGCDHIPAHPDLTPPKTIAADTYGATEVAGLIWLCIGDGAVSSAPVETGLAGAASVTIDAPAATVAAGLALPEGMAAEVQPVLSGRCRVHVTAEPDRLMAAVALAEALRRHFELPAIAAAE